MFSEIKLFDNFEFPISCTSIKFNNEHTQVIATGNYPPQFKIYYTNETSEFLERRIDAELVDFCFVGRNSRKIAFLRNDKTIEFFNNHISYFKLRIADFGRNIERFSQELFYSTENQLYQIDLHDGTAKIIYESDININYFSISKIHGIISLFTDNSVIFFDFRTKKYIKNILLNEKINTGSFDNNLKLSLSTITQFKIIDLRADDILENKDIKLINKIKNYKNKWFISNYKGIHLYEEGNIIDKLKIKGVNSFDLRDNIIFAGFDDGKIKTYYTDVDFIPEWCSHAEHFIKN